LRRAYRTNAEEEPRRIVMVDGRPPRDVVAERIWAAVKQRLHPERARAAESAAP